MTENLQAPPIETCIESIAFGGKGVARINQRVYFVPDTLPGDRVLIQATRDHGRYLDATVIQFLERSPAFVASPCQFSEECGGCQWLNARYDDQLLWKKNFIESALKRVGKLSSDFQINMHRAPSTLQYRNRVHMKGRCLKSGAVEVGFYKQKSNDLVVIDSCKAITNAIDVLIHDLSTLTLKNTDPQNFKFAVQETRNQSPKNLIVTVFVDPQSTDGLLELISYFKNHDCVQWAGTSHDRDQAQPIALETDQGITYHTLPNQFQQGNFEQNQALRLHVKELVSRIKPRRIMDLYCGSGNLSLQFISDSTYVEGIEFDATAIFCAKYNLEQNNLTNAIYISGDAEAHMWKCSKKGEIFDLVIADPPRTGMYKTIIPLKNMKPQWIIYVSCDPATMARDVGSLCKFGYEIEEVSGYDFFPNTFHVETITLLRRQI